MSDDEFQGFPKIGRLNKEWIATEKIDGTNAQVVVSDDGQRVRAGSRTRWITPGEDNFGFAAWVAKNADELLQLGPGQHFGEWWGSGIQRGYGLKEKRFSLFNVSRWTDSRPACCGVVPTLFRGKFDALDVRLLMTELQNTGSLAAPGFMKPEGIVLFCTANNALFKKTFEKDDEGKGT